MVSRRQVVVGGTSATLVALVGGALGMRSSSPRGSSAPPVASPPIVSAPARTPVISAIEQPASAASTAWREDPPPLRIDWVGGSDVAWQGVSLPDVFARRVTDVAGRRIDVRTRTRQAVMASGVRELVAEAAAERTDAIVMSINPVWLHWDEVRCDDIAVPRERYGCLLTPSSARVTAQRTRELGELIDRALAVGVPLYVYTQPHSADVLADPVLSGRIGAAEEAIAGYDPHQPNVRVVARIFSRDLTPMREGAEFHDMVHPTASGADLLGTWLATDITRFWASLDLGR